jgi:Predicted permeases
MKVLDLFLVKEFLTPFVFILVIMVGVWMGSSYLQELFSMMAVYGLPLHYAGIIMLLRIPFIVAAAMPASIVVSAVIALGLSRQGELKFLRTNGVSVFRILAAPIVLSVILTGLTFLLSEFVVPAATVATKKILFLGMHKGTSPLGANRTMASSFQPNGMIERVIYLANPNQRPLGSVVMLNFEKNKPMNVMCAPKAQWSHGDWILNEGHTFEFGGEEKRKLAFQKIVIPGPAADDFKSLFEKSSHKEMGFFELKDYLAKKQLEKSAYLEISTRLWDKLWSPFGCICMLLAGSIVVLNTNRKSIFHPVYPALILIVYYFMRGFAIGLAENGRLAPVSIATAIPAVIVGTLVTVYLLWKSGELNLEPKQRRGAPPQSNARVEQRQPVAPSSRQGG